MIPMTVGEIAAVVDGTPVDADVVVDAPAAIDSRRVAPGGLFVALPGENTDGHDFVPSALTAGASASLVARPVEGPHVQVADVAVALARLARHVHDRLTHPLDGDGLRTVGITGSAGKTSTKDLLAHVLEAAGPVVAPEGSFNNELGVPLTVLRADSSTTALVVEMGARGMGHIATLCAIAPPTVGVVLNVGTAHVGEFGSVEAIAIAKGELVEALPPAGTAVLNADDHRVAAMADRTSASVLTFGQAGQLRFAGLELTSDGWPEVSLEHAGTSVTFVLPQPGLHHGSNAAAVAAAALALGLDLDTVAERLATASARSPHRMARAVTSEGIVVVDDAYNANPESMAAALQWLARTAEPGRATAVLGAMLELGEESLARHRELGRLAQSLGLARVVAIGTEAAPIAEAAGAAGVAVPDVDVAIATLRASLRSGDVVLVKASRGCRLERVADALLDDTRHTADGS